MFRILNKSLLGADPIFFCHFAYVIVLKIISHCKQIDFWLIFGQNQIFEGVIFLGF